MISSPRVSIGMPVFNGERFIAEAIDSILAQTFEDFELIISDNASIDETEEICRRYAEKDHRVIYIRNRENLGAAYNYNQTFHLSSGEFFKWQPHDDILEPEFLERCVEALDNDPAAVMSYTGWAPIDETGAPIEKKQARYQPWRADSLDPTQRSRFIFRMEARPPSAIYGLFRSDVMRRTKLYRPIHGGDHIMIAEALLYGPFHEVAGELFLNRWHQASGGKIPSYRKRVDWWRPVGRSGRLGRDPVTPYLMFSWTMVRTAAAQVDSIRRSPLSRRDKMRCLAQVPGWLAGQLWRVIKPRLPKQA